MKKMTLALVSVLLFISCHKKDVGSPEPLPAQTISNLSYGTDAAQKLDLYLPANRSEDSTRLIILVHGGAWVEGDKADFNAFVPVLQQRFPGYAVANINYRLATASSNHFPTQENDMKAAVDFLIGKSASYHIAPKFILLGASAGGHMALLQAYKYSSPRIEAVVDFFGPTNMTDLYNTAAPGSLNQVAFQLLMGGTPVSNPAAFKQSSPINFVTAQSPPTSILHGSTDDVVPVAQSIALKNKLETLGVVSQMVTYPNVGHGVWPDPLMNDAFDKIELFVKTNVH
jgi:acetyl esterase/lipase